MINEYTQERIPVTMAFDHERKRKNDRTNSVLISGFGGGLSASAGIITLDPKAYYKFFQYEGKNGETEN